MPMTFGGDDRKQGQGIRRRQGGRPSNYHDDWYPRTQVPEPGEYGYEEPEDWSAWAEGPAAAYSTEANDYAGETFETYDSGDLAEAARRGAPGALEEQVRRRQYQRIPGSDGSTGAR